MGHSIFFFSSIYSIMFLVQLLFICLPFEVPVPTSICFVISETIVLVAGSTQYDQILAMK